MKGSEQLKKALAAKQRGQGKRVTVHVPHEVKYAEAGTHVARDGKPYTITYEKEPQ